MMILVFVMALALLAPAQAAEKSESLRLSSSHFTARCYYDAYSGIRLSNQYSIEIRPRDERYVITKVELSCINNRSLSVYEMQASKGNIRWIESPESSQGSILIENIYNPGVDITVPAATGKMDFERFIVYYDDTGVDSLKNTATTVRFNGMDWYVMDYDGDEYSVTLLAKECVEESDTRYHYKDSPIENILRDYYTAQFSAVDSAVMQVTPGHLGADRRFIADGNPAKLWLPSVPELKNLPKDVMKHQTDSFWYWWTRDGGIGSEQAYGIECTTGNVHHSLEVTNQYGVRPALRLDLSKVYYINALKVIRMRGVKVGVTGLTLTAESEDPVDEGGMPKKLTAALEPGDAEDKTILWNVSSDPTGEVKLYSDQACTREIELNSATKVLEAFVRGIHAGTVTVMATSNDNSAKSASVDVTVVPVDVTGVTLDENYSSANDIRIVTAKIQPENATDKTVIWSVSGDNADAVKLYADAACDTLVGSGATDVLTVYARANKEGTATVTATSSANSAAQDSHEVTMTAVAHLTVGGSTRDCFSMATAFSDWNKAENAATLQLLTDANITSTIHVTGTSGTKTLDLNNHDVFLKTTNGGSVICVEKGATLKLQDNSAEATGYIRGGEAYGNGDNDEGEGGGVYVMQGGTFILESGVIASNYAGRLGGGVYNEGTFTMTGGYIARNSARYGAGVFSEGTFTMTGGVIESNGGDKATTGGGVYVYGSTFTMSAGTIRNNKSRFSAGVNVEAGIFKMTGGTITGNSAIYANGGVLINGSTFEISGAPVITGNMRGRNVSANDNLNLYDGTVINIIADLTPGASIGVRMTSATNNYTPNPDVFTEGLRNRGLLDYFSSDDPDYTVVSTSDGEAKLMDKASILSVKTTPGEHMMLVEGSGEAEQSNIESGAAIVPVIYTADEGYYFPENYSVAGENGITVTRDSYTQITISGTPTADTAITLPEPTEKTRPETPTTPAVVDCATEANNDGKITGVTEAMEYQPAGADSWTAVEGAEITGLVPGDYAVRVKATDISLPSDPVALTILGVAASPTFTPEADTYEEAQRVEIHCATEDAVIYYTTDGSEPTADSTPYEEPIPVKETATIRAIAVVEGMNNSAVAEASYTITMNLMSVAAPVFEEAEEGYAQPKAQAIMISNGGSSNAVISGVTLSGGAASSFTLTPGTEQTVSAGQTNFSYTLCPNAGLSAGTYTATITVSFTGRADATAEVSFTVTEAPAPGSGIEVGDEWMVGEEINLRGYYFFADDTDKHYRLAGDQTVTVSEPYGQFLDIFNQWVFPYVIYTDADTENASLWITPPGGKTADDVPLGFRIAGGDGSKTNPFWFELVLASNAVNVTAGSHMTKTADSGEESQTGLSGKMTPVVYTADEGWYFPESYSVEEVKGVKVTRNNYKQITVSGLPTADAELVLRDATAATAFGTPDFILPASLTAAEEKAFEGIAASIVEVPATCQRIGDYAFRNCPNLTQIRLPADCELGTDVFDGCELVFVYSAAGSPAQTYCQTHENCVFTADTQN